jgi:N-acetylglutamate synthase
MTDSLFDICEMTNADYCEVACLWRDTEGVGLDACVDTQEGIASYLARNPGLSFVARVEGQIVGAVLCGHDGRRGYLHHLAVAQERRRAGIGCALVERCLAKLAASGIPKCNIFLFGDNELGEAFWQQTGWTERADLKLLQKETPVPEQSSSQAQQPSC